MDTNNNSDDILKGWPKITEYAKMSRPTIRKLSQRGRDPFPIAKAGKAWFTTRTLIQNWHVNEIKRQKRARKTKK